ncbi:MAG: hypothetical protein ACM3NF_00020 [Gemmatimonadota bacterium]
MGGSVLDEYRADVERIFGGDLVSLTLYGLHADEEPSPGAEASVLVVVRELAPAALEAYHGIAHRYARRGIPAPPILTEDFLRESADVFPLEFLGMAERRRVLSGRDVVAEIPIATKNLRHQVEFELKGKLLALRRMYMQTFGRKELARLLLSTVGPLVSVARGLLLLAARQPGAPPAAVPHDKEEIVAEIEKRFAVSLHAVREALAARKAGTMSPSRAREILFPYLEEAARLCSLSDRFPAGDDA